MAVTIGLNFKKRNYVYTKQRYKREIKSLVETSLDSTDSKVSYYFSKTSESVYILVKPKHSKGYIIFAIKGHKMLRGSSTKVFNTTSYDGFIELGKSISKYIEESLNGRYPLFNFKYGNYIGMSTILNLSSKGYKITVPSNDFIEGDFSRVDLIRGKELFRIRDEVFINRLTKLINNELVRLYETEGKRGLLYVTDLGLRVYSESELKYRTQYEKDLESNALDGIIESMIPRER